LNNGASVLVATIAYHLRDYWRGPRWLALILVFPSAQLGFLAFVGWRRVGPKARAGRVRIRVILSLSMSFFRYAPHR
jgi:hypothetical protein